MTRLRVILAAALIIAGIPATAPAGVYLSISYGRSSISRNAYYAPSPMVGVRKELARATADLNRAVVAASKNDAMAGEVKAAQAASNKAKQDYAAALAAARQQLAADPHIGPLQKAVAELEARMRSSPDLTVRLGIAQELMAARNAMNVAEWEVMGVDPDLAVTKVAIAEAAGTLRDTQSRRQAALQQDPGVVAAKQHVDALRQQLARR